MLLCFVLLLRINNPNGVHIRRKRIAYLIDVENRSRCRKRKLVLANHPALHTVNHHVARRHLASRQINVSCFVEIASSKSVIIVCFPNEVCKERPCRAARRVVYPNKSVLCVILFIYIVSNVSHQPAKAVRSEEIGRAHV